MGSDNSEMEELTNNPGLQHIAEKIFSYLSLIDLHQCLLVEESWSEVIDRNLLLRKCVEVGMVKRHGKKLILNEEGVDPYWYRYEIITADILPLHWAVMKGLTEVVKILAPLATTSLNQYIQFIDNDYVRLTCCGYVYCDCDYESSTWVNPIEIAAEIGLIEIVETLANLDPNQDFGSVFIIASKNGYTDLVKKLLSPKFNHSSLAPKLGCYNCMYQYICDGSYSCYCPPRINGHIDVVKLLAPYSCYVHRMPCHVDIYTCCKFLEEFDRFGSFYENIYYDFLSSLEYEKIITDERRNRKFAKREKRKTKTKAKESKKSENKPEKISGRKTINENCTRKIKHYDRKTMELLNFL